MKIGVKLIGRLGKYADNADRLSLGKDAIINEALSTLGLPDDQVGPVSLNGELISKADQKTRLLQEGDSLTIMPPIKGG